MKKRIIILTNSELRHVFFRKYMALSEEIEVINSYCEGGEKTIFVMVKKDNNNNNLRLKNLLARQQSEKDFFWLFIEIVPDYPDFIDSKPIQLPQGEINISPYTQKIINSNPDLLVAYGCSLIKEPLLSAFQGRFLNVHLGLSPYYRGSGTNYWPLVNGEPEYVGATFMHMDAGIDTGEIIHQIRAKCCWGDTPHQIGNRLIVEMAKTYRRIVENFDRLERMPQLSVPPDAKLYRKRDYTEESVLTLRKNFRNGMIEKYLDEEAERCAKVPIIENPALK